MGQASGLSLGRPRSTSSGPSLRDSKQFEQIIWKELRGACLHGCGLAVIHLEQGEDTDHLESLSREWRRADQLGVPTDLLGLAQSVDDRTDPAGVDIGHRGKIQQQVNVSAGECALYRLVKLLDTFSVLERAFQLQATNASALSNLKIHVVALSQPPIFFTPKM